MRNRTYLWIISASMLLAGGIILSQIKIHTNDKRKNYQDYLTQVLKEFPDLSKEEIESLPKMDRPDLAGYADYLKTVDPALKTVPNWRATEAYSELKNQPVPFKSALDELNWTAHPTDMGGRTRSLMFDPNDPTHSKVWAGSVTGGLWVSTDPINGQPWTPVNDFYTNLSISALTYDPNNTTTFYAGTGESQTALIIYRESSGRGSGLYESKDAGQTWALIPSTSDWAYVTDVVVRSENGQSVIYAGVVSGYYKGIMHESQPSDGLYRSTDGGQSWTQVLPMLPSNSRPYAPSDIELNADGSRIFVGTTYHWDDREGAACILYSDNGTDWTVLDSYYNQIIAEPTNKYPGRVMLGHAPSNPDILYAAIASGYVRGDKFIGYECYHILKTTNKGVNWSNVPSVPGFASLAWHALVITVSPFNPNMVWIGGLDTWRTTNGGQNWIKYSNWAEMYGNGSPQYVHADCHVIKFRPGSDTDMIIATDGGIFGTRTAPASTPTFFEMNRGYSTLQYYSCAIHPDAGALHFMGGLQDNGTMFYKRGKTPTFVDMLSGGDGALCFIDENNPTIHITTVYHNMVYLWNAEKESDPVQRGGRSFNSGMFVNAMDYNSRDRVLFANRMREEGTYPNQIEVIGVSESSVNGSSRNLNTNIEVPYSCVKFSPHSPLGLSTLYLGSLAGHLFKQEDVTHAGTLTNLTPEEFPTANVSCIDIGQSEDTLLVTFSNYGVESVWFSVDGGQNWLAKEGNLPDIPVRWALIHPANAKQVMLATELGIWTTTNILADPVVWIQNISGMANVRVEMVKFRKSDNTVLAATHGRGMFTTIWNPDFSASVPFEELHSQIRLFPNPSEGMIQIEFASLSKTELLITDGLGRVVLSKVYESGNQTGTQSFDLSNQPKGIYTVSLIADGKRKTSKLILQ